MMLLPQIANEWNILTRWLVSHNARLCSIVKLYSAGSFKVGTMIIRWRSECDQFDIRLWTSCNHFNKLEISHFSALHSKQLQSWNWWWSDIDQNVIILLWDGDQFVVKFIKPEIFKCPALYGRQLQSWHNEFRDIYSSSAQAFKAHIAISSGV